MNWKHIFARKDLEALLAEAAGEHRLHRVLGPWSLTALGVGCIIGAGIFVVTGRAAALDAGPGVILSYAIAGVGCALAALCYAEFAAMAPVAGSAYTYAYTTLGEIFAWIIGWDLILEYAMGCATVASAWTSYLNKLLAALSLPQVPEALSNDPFSGGYLNLPSVLIMALITTILVLGIRESARTNAALVAVKLVVVVFVIFAGWSYVNRANWTTIPVAQRRFPQEKELIPGAVKSYLAQQDPQSPGGAASLRKKSLPPTASIVKGGTWNRSKRPGRRDQGTGGAGRIVCRRGAAPCAERGRPAGRGGDPAPGPPDGGSGRGQVLGHPRSAGAEPLAAADRRRHAQPFHALRTVRESCWARRLSSSPSSASIPSPRTPKKPGGPQRDVPIGILVSLGLCTLLYIVVAAVITGMVPYPEIDIHAPIAAAFEPQAGARTALAAVLAGPDCRRRPGWHDERAAGAVLSQGADFHGHVPRRTVAAGFRHGPSPLPHAARGHDAHRRGDLPDGRLHADLYARRDGQRRHAHGLRDGLRGGVGSSATNDLPRNVPSAARRSGLWPRQAC